MSDRTTTPTKDALGEFRQSTDENVRALEQRPQGAPNGLIIPGGKAGTWIALPLAGGVTVGIPNPQYTLDADGWVHLRGVLGANAGFGVPATFATLPVGYRPPGQVGFVAWSGISGGARAASIGNVSPAGVVTIESVGGLAAVGTYFFALDQILYYVGAQ